MSAATSATIPISVASDGQKADPTRWSLACMKSNTTGRSAIMISTQYSPNELGFPNRAFGVLSLETRVTEGAF